MNNQQEDLRPYRKFGVTLLQLMGLLFVAGLLLNGILKIFF
ncbi:MAG: hypothetical protein P4M14_09490 [Gammaproteobacteria bacterium]|nr:hypothetical protein [Gammaproteobacteria bacterium]